MSARVFAPALIAAALSTSLPCAAQLGGLGDLMKKLPFDSNRPASAPAGSSTPAPSSDAKLLPVKPKAGVEDTLKPDLLCRRFEESSDVWQALAQYGGDQAQTRMTRILSSDFKFADLTPEDKKMLRYIAYTTVWIPASVETGFGKLYVAATRKRESTDEDRSEAAQLERIKTQLSAFKSHIDNFPGSVDIVIDRKLLTGAYSLVGGLIVLSLDFLNRMDEKEPVKRLIVAHELSHLYKRHTVKELQYQLVTSAGGFDLAKKLLSRANPKNSANPLEVARNAMDYAKSANDLYDFVRSHQVAFNINQEFEADACSVQWMKRSGVDPKPLVSALAELESVQKENAGSYAKTHPSNQERQKNLLVATGQAPAASAAKPGTTTSKAKKP